MVIGMCASTAVCMSVYHCSVSVSMRCVGGLSGIGGGGGMSSRCCLNPSQFALLKLCLRCVGICIGFVDMRVIMGRWSLVLMSPCLMCMLWCAKWLQSTMSGLVAVFWRMNVGKLGPMYLSLRLCIKFMSAVPTVLFCVYPNVGWCALRSPMMYMGMLCLSRESMSGVGR